ncbi:MULTISPECIES: DUF4411 family protein [Thermodesulfovibrio]|uniref:PIN domain protein n=1 Tax=Thermodesulfovibrio yellowstonii (strain ATCC 51303 / DSM 11347 / YP87) TaxID=289376 RepID=B5YKA8_THEYD|nr:MULTISPECIES: DUF4411 family protein [Thermodesulfovibrio]ACI20240.1 conserved hypothetical protein [Thermodesulfovibrio yellowstonii DSM 11347]MDI6865286.1 DUF4411 family protein [Thermodesulfovibrio yellowstonii]
MDREETYLLDANVFIEAARRYYAFDIAPPFWKALSEFAEKGKLISIDRVKNELLRGKDELSKWAKGSFFEWFKSTDDDFILTSYRRVIEWAENHSQFTQEAKKEFYDAENADAWLVAYALSNRNIIVTHEVYKPDVKKEIPIPNICRDFRIEYIDTFEMLRRLNFKFK